jgi:hypothetical protein
VLGREQADGRWTIAGKCCGPLSALHQRWPAHWSRPQAHPCTQACIVIVASRRMLERRDRGSRRENRREENTRALDEEMRVSRVCPVQKMLMLPPRDHPQPAPRAPAGEVAKFAANQRSARQLASFIQPAALPVTLFCAATCSMGADMALSVSEIRFPLGFAAQNGAGSLLETGGGQRPLGQLWAAE